MIREMRWNIKKILALLIICMFCASVINQNARTFFFVEIPFKIAMKAVKEIPYIDYALNRSLIMPDKFWVHRMNNPESVSNEELTKAYKGIEIDIIFFSDENQFDVNHDSKGFVENSLDSYLAKLHNKTSKIWLDLKNLDSNNAEKSMLTLNELLRKHQIDKSRVIVESGNYQALGLYKQGGFYTSYYVPYLKLEDMTLQEMNREKEKLQAIINTGNVSALSFPSKLYTFIKSGEFENIDFLTWDRAGGMRRDMWYQTYWDENARKMIEDNQIRVILVGDRKNHVK